ncbi:unnamed protein product [Meganyctiphanes norvegica]|uniref:Uncharacterized protein n=1 Tax=Meganyctiphanes norvegica TaxID=48144 RepID=A0AAV2S368_MEGNR
MVGKTRSGIMVRDFSNSYGHRPHHIVNYPRREYIVTKPKILLSCQPLLSPGGGGCMPSPKLKILHGEREIEKRGKEEKRKEIKKNIGKYIIFYITFSLYI